MTSATPPEDAAGIDLAAPANTPAASAAVAASNDLTPLYHAVKAGLGDDLSGPDTAPAATPSPATPWTDIPQTTPADQTGMPDPEEGNEPRAWPPTAGMSGRTLDPDSVEGRQILRLVRTVRALPVDHDHRLPQPCRIQATLDGWLAELGLSLDEDPAAVEARLRQARARHPDAAPPATSGNQPGAAGHSPSRSGARPRTGTVGGAGQPLSVTWFRQAELAMYPPNPDSDDASERYVLHAFDTTIQIGLRSCCLAIDEDGRDVTGPVPCVHVDPHRDAPNPLLVAVRDTGEHAYGG